MTRSYKLWLEVEEMDDDTGEPTGTMVSEPIQVDDLPTLEDATRRQLSIAFVLDAGSLNPGEYVMLARAVEPEAAPLPPDHTPEEHHAAEIWCRAHCWHLGLSSKHLRSCIVSATVHTDGMWTWNPHTETEAAS